MTRLHWDEVSLAKQGRQILDKVSMSVKSGEMIGLVGPNGAGKTALLRLAVGLDHANHGAVLIDGEMASSLDARERARRLAYLPQQAEAAWPISVQDAVGLGRMPHGDHNADAIADALAAVDMAGHGHRLLTRLSGGERALVLLARALAVRAGLLLLDEPTANLDPAHQLQVMEVLRRRADQGDAVVVVLHDLALAARCCDRLLVLHRGRLAAQGSGSAILDDPLLRQVFRITVERGHVEGRPVFLPSSWVA
jgi:iron complex transport system ATP-binding protein